MAKSKAAASHVHAQFRERSVEKTYLAITCGVPAETEFLVDAPIHRHDSIKCVLQHTPSVGCIQLDP